ncbi:EamA family transporter [Candidatus Gracilibacteria bacterium]|nr:EamA family transporter [Candidatus Gracilibacteria bacterium]NUJ99249.1 EamA family transporter [Candidatus Gracilibacteria bacterium]
MYIFFAFLGISLALMKDFHSLSFQFGKGEILALCISFVMGIAVMISKSLPHLNAFLRTFITFSFAGILVLSFLLFQNGIEYFYKFFTIDFLFPIFILALTAGVLGRGLKELGTNYVSASIVLVIMLLEPIMQMITAYIFANEKLLFFNLIGIFLVFSMAVLISRKK